MEQDLKPHVNYRFAVQILYFDCEQFILRTIANCAPFVEKIYVVYSPEPWSAYNKEARSLFKNPSNPEVIKQSPHYDKIEIIEGVWETEEDQRNAGLNKARADGFDFLIIQDADEFYLPEEYQKNIDEITENPNFDYYRNPWIFFWKNVNTILINYHPYNYGNAHLAKPYKQSKFGYNANFAINLNTNVKFANKRLPSSNDSLMLAGYCHHLSFALNDEQLERKLKTWGHSHEFKINTWLETKWYCWNGKQKYLHMVNPAEWLRTESYAGKLPKEIEDYKPGFQHYKEIPMDAKIKAYLLGLQCLASFILKDIKYLGLRLIKKQ